MKMKYIFFHLNITKTKTIVSTIFFYCYGFWCNFLANVGLLENLTTESEIIQINEKIDF